MIQNTVEGHHYRLGNRENTRGSWPLVYYNQILVIYGIQSPTERAHIVSARYRILGWLTIQIGERRASIKRRRRKLYGSNVTGDRKVIDQGGIIVEVTRKPVTHVE